MDVSKQSGEVMKAGNTAAFVLSVFVRISSGGVVSCSPRPAHCLVE